MALLRKARGPLFRKYVVYFVVLVSVALLASGLIGLYFSYQENRAALVALQHEKALAAAAKIEQYINEIEHQIGWTTLPQVTAGAAGQRRFDYLKLLRQVPAITEASLLDRSGREQLRVSRLGLDVTGSGADYARDPRFTEVKRGRTYFSPVYFRKETEPYMTIAVPASRDEASVTTAEVNLKFVWDVVSSIKIGEAGYAYVVDARGQLISHPDISLVLQKTDLAWLPQVRAAHARADGRGDEPFEAQDPHGRPVLAASAAIPTLGWPVFVEQPLAEAFAPIYALIQRTGVLLLFGLLLSVAAGVMLARRMVTPIQALQAGAAEIGAGALDHRLDIRTGDELEALGEQFNRMAAQLQESYADLERKIADRTRELELANQAKSRFFAAASHDLRQPMHALGLFIAQLRNHVRAPATREIVGQAEASVAAMRNLLDGLLDISKLDAGVLTPHFEDFPINPLLQRMESSFGSAAREKGLTLRAVPSRLVVRSDPVLLERIVLNLVSNAIRYTARGGIVVGCRRRGGRARIEVWDSGMGIPADKQQDIFQEFFQLANPEHDRGKGLGLGLAIVERSARLLDHRIALRSTPGEGSMFAIELPLGDAQAGGVSTAPVARRPGASLNDKFVVVVDDEALVREGMQGLLASWGCRVLSVASGDEALAALAGEGRTPDAIICDYRLRGEENGIAVIQRLQSTCAADVPAVLISGDTAPERLREAKASGYRLLHKPVQPARLRAVLSHLCSTAAKPQTAGTG